MNLSFPVAACCSRIGERMETRSCNYLDIETLSNVIVNCAGFCFSLSKIFFRKVCSTVVKLMDLHAFIFSQFCSAQAWLSASCFCSRSHVSDNMFSCCLIIQTMISCMFFQLILSDFDHVYRSLYFFNIIYYDFSL